MKANDAILKNLQTNTTSLTNLNIELKNMFGQFIKMNTASSSGSGTLPGNIILSGTAYPVPTIPTTSSSPVVEHETEATKDMVHPTNNESIKDLVLRSLTKDFKFLIHQDCLIRSSVTKLMTLPGNTITNPKEDLKGITTRSGTAYQGPMIPTTPSLLPVVKRETKVTKDTVHPTNNGSTEYVQATVVLTESLILNPEPVVSPIIEPDASPVSAPRPNQKPSIPPSIKSLLTNKDKLCELARTPLNEYCSAVLLKKLPEKLGDPGMFLIPYFDADPQVPLILGRSFLKTGRALIDVFEGELTFRVGKEAINFNLDQTSRYSANYNDMTANRIDVIDMACEEYSQEVLTKSDKSSIDKPPEVELKDLPPHLEYVFLEGDNKVPVIIAKDLSVEEKTALITVLKSYKRAIAWKLSDIKGIDLEFCTHKILMEEDFEPAVQHQRRVNPKIHDIIKNEVLKLLDAGLIYPISDSPWVSLIHCVSKKGGFTIVENEENELIPTRLVRGWRVRID
uniref:Reverse transcriptase domain-containing protein n=1 Tax=Tanacetum cinerariifolium TaxID=118510 RepID=A0A699KC51_TANCI|nr:reverse transcriptase domain-containing protein [Tanacetum cinerariifolium]